jgi:hypothetical protein
MDRQFFAQLNQNNVVTDVHCVTQEFLNANPERYTGVWVETFFNVDNKTYANIGYIYDETTQDFFNPNPPIIDPNDL